MPTFISTFAGIGGFDRGLELAGWTSVGMVEIDPFCQKVLKKHWPDVPLHDDIKTAKEWWLSEEDRPQVDLVCGGFPCQDVSVAGKRAGLGAVSDEIRTRTGLFYDAIDFIAAVKPTAVLLENVPGLLTSNRGADFAVVLDALAEVGFVDIEWRVLDSQFFGVPQRRRRVFVVGRTGDARRGPVLLEPEGGERDPRAGEQAGQEAPRAAAARAGARGGRGLVADDGKVTSLTAALGGGGPDLAHAQAGWIFPDPAGGAAPSELTGFPDPAGTVTTRIGKGVNSTVDDGAVVYEREHREEDRAPARRRVIRRRA